MTSSSYPLGFLQTAVPFPPSSHTSVSRRCKLKQEYLLASYPPQDWHKPPSPSPGQQESAGIAPGTRRFCCIPRESRLAAQNSAFRSLTVGTGGWGHADPEFPCRRGCRAGREERPSPRMCCCSQCRHPPNQPINLQLTGSSLIIKLRLQCGYTRIFRHDHHLEARALNEARKIYSQDGPKKGLEIFHEPKSSNNESWVSGPPSSNPVLALTSTSAYATAGNGSTKQTCHPGGMHLGKEFCKEQKNAVPFSFRASSPA